MFILPLLSLYVNSNVDVMNRRIGSRKTSLSWHQCRWCDTNVIILHIITFQTIENIEIMSVGDDPVQTGRRILTALYLCMLGVCFLVPIFFYFRMHCDERRNRQLRDIEIAGITQAMNDSQILQREESRAARRKYREERRARIVQLFTPVRMVRSIIIGNNNRHELSNANRSQ